jgi:tetrahydromethanopterin S-methyltransferase subunit C
LKKLYSTIFKNSIFKISQVVADPFIALAFIFSPFGIKHQNGINLGPFNPIASPKSSNKNTKAIRV